MLAFKPKEDPLLNKMAKSGLFQFIMVVILGLGVTWLVVRTDRPQQWIQKINRFASIAPNTSLQVKAQNTEAGIAEDEAEDEAEFEAPPASANNWAARSIIASSTETISAVSGAALQVSLQSQASASAAAQGISTSVRMLEVDNEYLNTVVQQAYSSNSVLQDSEVKIFMLPSSMAISAIQNLSSTRLNINLGSFAFAGFIVPDRAQGFELRIAYKGLIQDVYSLGFLLEKRHPNDSLQIPIDFNLHRGEKLVIASNAILNYFEFDTEFANTPPFQIFRSADFRNQKTTFAIVVELQQ